MLQRFAAGYPLMTPRTAVALILCAAALYLTSAEPNKLRHVSKFAIASFLCVFGVSELGQHLAAAPFGFSNLIFSPGNIPATGSVVTMSPQASANLVLLSLALISLNRTRRLSLVSEGLVVASMCVTIASLIAHLYQARIFTGTTGFNRISLPAAICCAILAVGCLAANRKSRLVKLVLADSLGGTVARRLLPLALAAPIMIGGLEVIGQNFGFYNLGTGNAFSALASTMLLCGAIYYFSARIHRFHKKQQAFQRRMVESEARYRDLVDHGAGFISTHDLEGRMTMINPAALRMIGYGEEEVIGKTLRDLMPDEHQGEFSVYLRQILNEGISEGLLTLVKKDGARIVMRYNNVLITEPSGNSYVLGHAQEVTELLRAQAALKRLSLTDELTGIYNRRGFLTFADQQIKLESHSGTSRGLSLIFADMDGLKAINDNYGHEAGSEALADVARVLKSAVRDADIVARWGGDEFVILTIGAKDENAELMIDRIRTALDQNNAVSSKPYKLSCSLGVVSLDGACDIEEVVAEADERMYQDKRSRKAERVNELTPNVQTLSPLITRAPQARIN
ncbi:MAG: diguanylate cyclase [Blastocatellia bacterium]|nr:diguanylate cyclase [Blastocatellia bacterium]